MSRHPRFVKVAGRWKPLALTAITLTLVASVGCDAAIQTPREPTTTTAGDPSRSSETVDRGSRSTDPVPADVIVDLRTGETTDLPSQIASVDGAAEYQISPDGTRVAFTAPGAEGDPRQVFVADLAGTHARMLTAAFAKATPRWSPDGDRIVYGVAGASPGFIDISYLTVDREDSQDTLKDQWVSHASRSKFWQVGTGAGVGPDGQSIMFTQASGDGRFDLRSVPMSGGRSRLLVRNAAYGSFSPDGRTIAFLRMIPDTKRDYWPRNAGIWLANADGSDPQPLFEDAGFNSGPLTWKHIGPQWSPDGTRIAFVDPSDSNIYVIEVMSGNVTLVGLGGSPTWLDDDRLIIEGFGAPIGRFDLADLAGIWFDTTGFGSTILAQPNRSVFLAIGANGSYFLEGEGGLGSERDQAGTVEISGRSILFRPSRGATEGCSDGNWTLNNISLLEPDRILPSGGIRLCGSVVHRTGTSLHRLGAWPSQPDRRSEDVGSVRVRRADLIGTWVDEGGGTFYEYSRGGRFAYYWADPDWPYWNGFELAEAGTWELVEGRLHVEYEGGRTCIAPDGSMSVFNTYSDRRHRLETKTVELTTPRTMSLTTVRDACYDTQGSEAVQIKLFPRPRPRYTRVATLASGTMKAFGDTERWHIGLFQDDFRRLLCLGSGSVRHVEGPCGPEADPAPGWAEHLTAPLRFVGAGSWAGFGSEGRFGWGAFRDPIATIRTERSAGPGEWAHAIARTYDLPSEYGRPFTLFVAHCECGRVRVLGLDDDGRIIERVRL